MLLGTLATSTEAGPADPAPSKPKTAELENVDPKTFRPGQWRLERPPYPYEARAMHEEGSMTVVIVTDAKGWVSKATVFSSVPHPILDVATAKWAYARWHGPPNIKAKIPVTYALR